MTLNSGGLSDVEVDVFHGFHIHANNDDSATPGNGSGCIADTAAASSTWFTSADGHFNPTGETHSHHVGDMPVAVLQLRRERRDTASASTRSNRPTSSARS